MLWQVSIPIAKMEEWSVARLANGVHQSNEDVLVLGSSMLSWCLPLLVEVVLHLQFVCQGQSVSHFNHSLKDHIASFFANQMQAICQSLVLFLQEKKLEILSQALDDLVVSAKPRESSFPRAWEVIWVANLHHLGLKLVVGKLYHFRVNNPISVLGGDIIMSWFPPINISRFVWFSSYSSVSLRLGLVSVNLVNFIKVIEDLTNTIILTLNIFLHHWCNINSCLSTAVFAGRFNMSLIEIIASICICLFIFEFMSIIQLFEHFEVHEWVLEEFDCQEVLLVGHVVIEYDLSLLFLSEDIFKKFLLLIWGQWAETSATWAHRLNFIAFLGVSQFCHTLTFNFGLNHWLSLVYILYI